MVVVVTWAVSEASHPGGRGFSRVAGDPSRRGAAGWGGEAPPGWAAPAVGGSRKRESS